MENILTRLIDRVFSYNIFNNLFPGILYCVLLKNIFDKNVLSGNWLMDLVLCYFIGMIMSRIGSLIIEPFMKKFKLKDCSILNYAAYTDYVKASMKESMLVTLSEVNNTYRTLLACFVSLIFYKLYFVLNKFFIVRWNCYFFQKFSNWLLLGFLTILFAGAYIKQTSYIRKRIEEVLKQSDMQEE